METFGERVRRLRKQAGLTQQELARASGLSQSTISHIETGRNATSSELYALARALHAESVEYLVTGRSKHPRKIDSSEHQPGTITVPYLEADDVYVDDNQPISKIVLSRQWIATMLRSVTSPANLAVFCACGDSMTPTIHDGDPVLVDTGVREITMDGVYLLQARGRLLLRRARQRLDGTILVSSDNQNAGVQEELSSNINVVVLGRIVWVWHGCTP